MPPAPGCHWGPVPCPRKPEKLAPILAAVGGLEKSGVFHARVDDVWIGMRRLEMPDALEFPGMLSAVVELVGW